MVSWKWDRNLLPKPHIIQKYSTYNLPWNCDWKEACDRLLTSGENRRPPGKRKATANAQIHLELQGPQVDKTILKKKKVEGLILLIWKLTINLQWLKRFGTGIKDGHIDQWNGTESPEINLQLCNWVLTSLPSPLNGGKVSHFNRWCWNNWIVTCKRMESDT